MPKPFRAAIWVLVVLVATGTLAKIALTRGETLNAAWLLTAALCVYAIAYRFYSKMIAANVFALDATRTTPPPPCVSTTATTMYRRTDGSCSGITSRPSPGRDRSSDLRSRRSSATCPALSGSSLALHSAAQCKTS